MRCACEMEFTFSNVGSRVMRLKSRNSSWIVVTSLVELSGDHFGECAIIVAGLTSEKGIPDGELNAGIKRLPISV